LLAVIFMPALSTKLLCSSSSSSKKVMQDHPTEVQSK
jgi:hypothetical protein